MRPEAKNGGEANLQAVLLVQESEAAATLLPAHISLGLLSEHGTIDVADQFPSYRQPDHEK